MHLDVVCCAEQLSGDMHMHTIQTYTNISTKTECECACIHIQKAKLHPMHGVYGCVDAASKAVRTCQHHLLTTLVEIMAANSTQPDQLVAIMSALTTSMDGANLDTVAEAGLFQLLETHMNSAPANTWCSDSR